MSRLPELSSDLLALAMDDLELVEQDPAFTVDMIYWMSSPIDGVCAVCLAGAVMAKTLHAKPPVDGDGWGIFQFSERDIARLRALDHFRQGGFFTGVSLVLGHKRSLELRKTSLRALALSKINDPPVPPYELQPEAFKKGMRRAVGILRELGL